MLKISKTENHLYYAKPPKPNAHTHSGRSTVTFHLCSWKGLTLSRKYKHWGPPWAPAPHRQLSTGSTHSFVLLVPVWRSLCVRGCDGWHLWGCDRASSKRRRHSQGNQAGAQGSHHCWHQLGAECVGSSSEMTNLGCGCRARTGHWFTCCHLSPFWVTLRAASSSCPTHPVRSWSLAQPQGLQCPTLPDSSSAASLPGQDTVPGMQSQPSQQQRCGEQPVTREGTHGTDATRKNTDASSQRASDRHWQTCAAPSHPHSFPSIPHPK